MDTIVNIYRLIRLEDADEEIIKGFNYSLFIMLLGVTYLFSLAQMNGCLELLAKKTA